jgi:sugar phosphate isomerase/epimerase
MRLATSTCMVFNRPGGRIEDVSHCVKLCAQAGYRVMDMNFHDCAVFETPFTTARWEKWAHEIAETAHKNNIEFSQSHLFFYNFCDNHTTNREQLDELVYRSILGSEILGVKWAVIHAGTDFDSASPVKTSRQKNAEYFKPLIDFAEKHHVGIAIENLWELNISPQRRYTTSAEELMELLETLPYKNTGCCWDVEHAAIMGQDQIKALALIKDRIKATHISDYLDSSNDHLLPFSGKIDWPHVLTALKSVHYEGDFSFETFRFTKNLPDSALLPALIYSVAVGNFLLDSYNRADFSPASL